jgi:hypothetical protein
VYKLKKMHCMVWSKHLEHDMRDWMISCSLKG